MFTEQTLLWMEPKENQWHARYAARLTHAWIISCDTSDRVSHRIACDWNYTGS